MAPARNRLQKARTHPPKRSSENDSPTRHHRAQSDVPQTPHSQENRWKRKSRDARGRSNSVLTPKRQPLRELSPSERNERSPSPDREVQPVPPLLRMEVEREAQRAAQREQDAVARVERQARGTPSATYFKSPFPSCPSQILLPSPTSPSFVIPSEETPAEPRLTRELSIGTSDAPDFFSNLVPAPLLADEKRGSTATATATTRSVAEDEDSILTLNPRLSSDLYGSVNSRNSMMRSTIRSIQPSEEFPSTTSMRSSASSETLSTRCHKSTGGNWTIHPPMSASTRPTSINTRTPSPFGISTPRTPLFGPRSPGVSKDKRPVSTFGNPLSPFLENASASRPLSASDTDSGKISDFGSSDKLLGDLPSSYQPSAAQKAYHATANPDFQFPEVRSVSGMSCTTGEDNEPASLNVPKRAARPNERQQWSPQVPSTSTQAEPIQRLPTIPSGSHSVPPTESSVRNPGNASLVSLPSMHFDGSLPPSRPHTRDRGEESSTAAVARSEIPPIRNPWQSVDSMSFFNLMMGRENGDVRGSGSSSRPSTRGSNATVLYMAKGLPSWARVLGSSHPSTRSKPSNNSLRLDDTASHSHSRSSDKHHPHGSRAPSSSRPTNTAPTDSPASSEFSVASIRRPRNRPHSTIYSENWAPSPAPAEDDDDAAAAAADDSDNYSAGIEPHQPSTSHTNNPPRLSISEIPTTTDRSHGTQRRHHQHGPLRMFGPAGPDSNETPRLHREQSSTFRCFRPSSWIVGGGASARENPNRPAADRQMWLFCLGFVVPFAWFLAAFLPVPPRCGQSFSTGTGTGTADDGGDGEKGCEASGYAGRRRDDDDVPRMETGSGGVVDVEAQALEAGGAALAERERVRAVWWRTLNRRMSLLGVAVIVVVVAVAVTLTVM